MYRNQGLGPSNTKKFSKKTRGPRQFVDSIIPSPTDPQYTSTDSSDTGTLPTDLGHASTDFILSPAAYGYLDHLKRWKRQYLTSMRRYYTIK